MNNLSKAGMAAVIALAAPARCIDLAVPADYPTIASALAAAQDGDRIVLEEGTYSEGLTFPAFHLAIAGQGRDTTRIEGRIDVESGAFAVLEGLSLHFAPASAVYFWGGDLDARGCSFESGTFGGGLTVVNHPPEDGTLHLTDCHLDGGLDAAAGKQIVVDNCVVSQRGPIHSTGSDSAGGTWAVSVLGVGSFFSVDSTITGGPCGSAWVAPGGPAVHAVDGFIYLHDTTLQSVAGPDPPAPVDTTSGTVVQQVTPITMQVLGADFRRPASWFDANTDTVTDVSDMVTSPTLQRPAPR